ncbi:rhodanese/Cell cycle control phosphatase superfamily protein [Wolffia australiana]
MAALGGLSAPSRRSNTLRTRAQAPSSRGQELIRSGEVVALPPPAAAAALRGGGYKLLDVRPEWEFNKARVRSALHVPLFVEDKDDGLLTLLKKSVHLGYIGLWTGQLLTTFNDDFLSQVKAEAPDKEEKLLVACGEGLRSLVAVAFLHGGGYKNLAWLEGGFSRCKKDELGVVDGETELRFASVGGASYVFLRLLVLVGALGRDG